MFSPRERKGSRYRIESKRREELRSRNSGGMLLPDDGVLEAQLGGALLDLLLQPGLRSDQVLDELRHPPDGGVAVETLQTWSQVLRDGQRQVGGAWVQAVHDGQLYNLDLLIVSLSWRVPKEHVGEGKRHAVVTVCTEGERRNASSIIPEV